MITFYIAEFRRTVTREEVANIVMTSSPYTIDKGMIHERLDILTNNQQKVLQELEELKEGQVRLETAMGVEHRRRK